MHNVIYSYQNKFKTMLSCFHAYILSLVYILDYSRRTATTAVHKSTFYILTGVKYTGMFESFPYQIFWYSEGSFYDINNYCQEYQA